MTKTSIDGLHHVTAISGAAPSNLDFWANGLGLRFVKKTVNFDDPGTYHLYYGDELGRPGTALTFFPWAGVPRGRAGNGEAGVTQFSVPAGSLDFWAKRVPAAGGRVVARDAMFGEARILAEDRDGMGFSLVEVPTDPRHGWTGGSVGAAEAIRGFHGVTLSVADARALHDLLVGPMNYAADTTDGKVTRYRTTGASPAGVVDVAVDPGLPASHQGAGRVHHVAFAVPTRADLEVARAAIQELGLAVTPRIDRNYFFSIYFRTPAGILFEIASAEPGFTVDEPAETLGEALKLPAQHEHLRAVLETRLPKLAVPAKGAA
jgi:glyoxalase family protein